MDISVAMAVTKPDHTPKELAIHSSAWNIHSFPTEGTWMEKALLIIFITGGFSVDLTLEGHHKGFVASSQARSMSSVKTLSGNDIFVWLLYAYTSILLLSSGLNTPIFINYILWSCCRTTDTLWDDILCGQFFLKLSGSINCNINQNLFIFLKKQSWFILNRLDCWE